MNIQEKEQATEFFAANIANYTVENINANYLSEQLKVKILTGDSELLRTYFSCGKSLSDSVRAPEV